MFWAVARTVPLIVLSNAVTSWAYLYPDQFTLYFKQGTLIKFWVTLNVAILCMYLFVCSGAKFNVNALWIALPCMALGAFLAGYAYSKLGPPPDLLRGRAWYG
jgi:hypothetical protein